MAQHLALTRHDKTSPIPDRRGKARLPARYRVTKVASIPTRSTTSCAEAFASLSRYIAQQDDTSSDDESDCGITEDEAESQLAISASEPLASHQKDPPASTILSSEPPTLAPERQPPPNGKTLPRPKPTHVLSFPSHPLFANIKNFPRFRRPIYCPVDLPKCTYRAMSACEAFDSLARYIDGLGNWDSDSSSDSSEGDVGESPPSLVGASGTVKHLTQYAFDLLVVETDISRNRSVDGNCGPHQLSAEPQRHSGLAF